MKTDSQQRAEILQAIRDNGGEKSFIIAKTAAPIWRCLIGMVADGMLQRADNPDGSCCMFKIKRDE